MTAQVTGKQIVLPLRHGVSRDEVFQFSPSLADKVALDTSSHDVEGIAQQILEVVSSP